MRNCGVDKLAHSMKCKICVRTVLGMSEVCARFVPGLCRVCAGFAPDLCEVRARFVQDQTRCVRPKRPIAARSIMRPLEADRSDSDRHEARCFT